jgi:diaminopimelate epimerase
MHGLGNDFVVCDRINQDFQLNDHIIKEMADRHTGIGYDQLLLIEQSPEDSNSDFKFRIFNADGSEVEQCGNGARCVARYLYDFDFTQKTELKLLCLAGIMKVKIHRDLITVNMGQPRFLSLPDETITIEDQTISLNAVSLGNPHAVIFVDDTYSIPLEKWGQFLQKHPFFPQQVNVGFMQKLSQDHIRLRVFERGVGETLACGSGACAAVAVGIKQHDLDHRVTVSLPGGELMIEWNTDDQNLYMTGAAETVFVGEWLLN